MQNHIGKGPLKRITSSSSACKLAYLHVMLDQISIMQHTTEEIQKIAQGCTRCMALQVQQVACSGESTLDSGSCSLALPSHNSPQLSPGGVSIALERCLILCAPGRPWRKCLSHITSKHDILAMRLVISVANGCSKTATHVEAQQMDLQIA